MEESLMTRTLALTACLLLGAPSGHAQSPTSSTAPTITPGAWEMTVQLSVPTYWQGGAASSGVTTNRGVGGRIGYRPTSSRRALVEAYGMHIPASSNAYRRAPETSSLGVQATYLTRRADRRINPYVTGGIGLWRVNAHRQSSCRPEDGCLSDSGLSVEDATALSVVLGAGTYVTVHPNVALRAAARLHGPLAIGDDQGGPRPVLSVGVSIRP